MSYKLKSWRMFKQTEAQYKEFWNDKWWINHSGKYTFIYPLHLIWISSGQSYAVWAKLAFGTSSEKNANSFTASFLTKIFHTRINLRIFAILKELFLLLIPWLWIWKIEVHKRKSHVSLTFFMSTKSTTFDMKQKCTKIGQVVLL